MSRTGWTTSVPYVLTVALSSACLFTVQPMCARMLLPYLGGSYSVWTTCMLFFQAGLLGGYLYAHGLGRVGIRVQTALHLACVAIACVFLPPAFGRPPDAEQSACPVFWLLMSLVGTIGLPYLVLASSAPLLQVWLARSATVSSAERDPYFLYAASNAGSLAGLLAYPQVLEPLLTIHQQSYVWSIGFILFSILTAICGVPNWKRGGLQTCELVSTERSRRSQAKKSSTFSIGKLTLLKWLFLAFLPSSLLLGVTVHLTADVASLPLLWIVPLGVYLCTYIWSFSPRGTAALHLWIRWLPVVVLTIVVVLLTEATEPLLLIILLHLVGLFWIGMACHGELARSRPPVERLTTFYLCIATGGALGGVFNALLAPAWFKSLAEYPAVLALACLVPAFTGFSSDPEAKRSTRQRALDILLPAVLVLVTCGLAAVIQRCAMAPSQWRNALLVGLPLVICYTFSKRPVRFALGIAGLLLCQNLIPGVHGRSVERVRSFFGIHRITQDAGYRLLVHGNTEHGRQSLNPGRSREPLPYYTRSGPVGDLFRTFSPTRSRLRKVAVLGLGAGAMAAYAEADQYWTFYEIDPAVISLARQQFTYLSEAISRGVKVNIIQGDARVQVSRTSEMYDLIILDTFSSDSIPTHLFTREAFNAYRERLSDNGVLAVHYSSRYFNFRPAIGSLSQSVSPRLTALFREDLWVTDADKLQGKAPSKWAILIQGEHAGDLSLLSKAGWQPIQIDPSLRPWTDDYSNVLGALELSRE